MSSRHPNIHNNRYIGYMKTEQADLIEQIRNTDDIPNLRKIIYNIPSDIVKEAIERCERPLAIIKERGENPTDYLGELRKYQTVGTAFMYYSPRSILADGCGLGKTVEVSALINLLRSRKEIKKFIIAVETSAANQTQKELMKYTGLNVLVLPPEAHKLKRVINKTDFTKVDGIVIKHSTLRSDFFSTWLSLNLDEKGMSKMFDTFFLDESSVIKNNKTKMYEYTTNICNIVSRVHLMNATTFETNIMDIYYQLDMINDSLLPSKTRIQNEYCDMTKNSFWATRNGKAQQFSSFTIGGYKNQAKFKEALKYVYFGRSASDVGKDLPHIYKVYEVYATQEQQFAMAKGNRYNEVLNCPSLIEDMACETDRKTSPKLDRLCTLIENEFANQQVMVYCFHVEAQKAIARELEALGRKPVILNGECVDEERVKAQDGFNDGTFDVIITNVKKSLNLQNGNACIFYSLETNVAKFEQIRGRIDRHVDDEIKTFVLLLYKDTPEEQFFSDVVASRAQASRDLTLDAKGAADFFYEALKNEGPIM